MTDPQDPDLAAVAEADALLCGSLPGAVRAHAASLRWIQFWSAGVDGKLTPELFEGGVQIATSSGIHAVPCSEHVLALLFAFARGLPASLRAQQAHDWSARDAIADALFEPGREDDGHQGAGTIGQAIGARCQAFGMRTVGLRRDARASPLPASTCSSPYPLPRPDPGLRLPGPGRCR